jgi:hypothetical protein
MAATDRSRKGFAPRRTASALLTASLVLAMMQQWDTAKKECTYACLIMNDRYYTGDLTGDGACVCENGLEVRREHYAIPAIPDEFVDEGPVGRPISAW